MRRQAKTVVKLLRRLGPFLTFLFIADQLLTRLTRAQILLIFLREREQLAAMNAELPAGFEAQIRSAEQMRRVGGPCGAQLTPDFLQAAGADGHRCVVILHRGEVVNFQWLSAGLTRAYDDIWIGFGPRYLYGYNSFTAPDYRGMSLNRKGVVIAGQKLAVAEGQGLAGYISASNAASILSHSNLATLHLGFVVVWPRGTRGLRVYQSPSCRHAQLSFARR